MKTFPSPLHKLHALLHIMRTAQSMPTLGIAQAQAASWLNLLKAANHITAQQHFEYQRQMSDDCDRKRKELSSEHS